MNNPFRSGYNMPDNCFSTPYDEKVRCSKCDELFDECDMVEFEEEYMCESCYEDLPTCELCGDKVSDEELLKETEKGRLVCESCFESTYGNEDV